MLLSVPVWLMMYSTMRVLASPGLWALLSGIVPLVATFSNGDVRAPTLAFLCTDRQMGLGFAILPMVVVLLAERQK